ncbi:MAG TPA: AI-2E family transporter [Methanocella sp.]|jgi:predicted PurR-regulated permease PerM
MPGLLQRLYNAKWLIFGVALFLLLLWIMRPFLDVFIYAIFLYYITRPMRRWVSKYVKSEGLAVLVSLLLLALPIVLIITYTLLIGLSQLMSVFQSHGLSGTIPSGTLANLTTTFSGLQQNVSSGSYDLGNITNQDWYRSLSGYSGSLPTVQAVLLALGGTIADILFKAFIIFFVAFALLKDDYRIKEWFEKTFPYLVEEHHGLFARYMKGVDTDLQKIFFSNLLSIVFFAVIAVISYNLLNMFAPAALQIPSPILLGILTGVAALIPIIGMWLVVGPLTAFLIINSLIAGTFFANIGYFIFMFLFIFIFVTTVPGFVVGPYLARGNVNTGLLMFAYIIGPLVFGITGIFIGAIVLVLLTNYFQIVVPEFSRERILPGTGHPGGPPP